MLNIEINQAELHRLAQEIDLDLSRVSIQTSSQQPRRRDGFETWGHWSPGRITLFLGVEIQQNSRLRSIVHHLNETLLHELRHEWQAQHWSAKERAEKHGAYLSGSKIELDANEFAEAKSGSFRLVRLKPRVVAKSGFARLNHVRTAR